MLSNVRYEKSRQNKNSNLTAVNFLGALSFLFFWNQAFQPSCLALALSATLGVYRCVNDVYADLSTYGTGHVGPDCSTGTGLF